MMKLSFDFDDTLSNVNVQRYVDGLIRGGKYEVHIVTSRVADKRAPSSTWNLDLHYVANELGIPKERIHFTEYKPKYKFFNELEEPFIFHLDDDTEEIEGINLYTKTKGVLFVDTFNNSIFETLNQILKDCEPKTI